MKATNNAGHEWTGEKEDREWFIYKDDDGKLYSSREQPAYRITMDNSVQISVGGKLCIAPAILKP